MMTSKIFITNSQAHSISYYIFLLHFQFSSLLNVLDNPCCMRCTKYSRSIVHGFMVTCCCLVFCPKTGSLCLLFSRCESYLLNTNKARENLHGGAPDSFQTENSFIVSIEPVISRTEVRVLTTELRRRKW